MNLVIDTYGNGGVGLRVRTGVGNGSGNSARTRFQFVFRANQAEVFGNNCGEIGLYSDLRGSDMSQLMFDVVGEWELQEFQTVLRGYLRSLDELKRAERS